MSAPSSGPDSSGPVPSGPASHARAARGAWLTVAVVAGGLFLSVASTTVVGVALPTMGRDLGASAAELEWIVDAYVLVYASLLIAGGVIGDRRGRKGVFLLGIAFFALGSLMTGLAPSAVPLLEGQGHGWRSPLIVAAFAVGIAALAAFVVWERHLAEPLVDVSLFARPAFTAANVAVLLVFFSFVGGIVYLSAFLQQVQGHSPVTAGLEVSALGIGFAIAAPLSGRMVGRIGARTPMLAGLIISGAATLVLLRVTPATGIGALWWNFALVGGGVGLCLTPMTAIAVSAVGAARAGMASAVHNAMRQVGQVLGVAVLGALVYSRLPDGSGAVTHLPAARAGTEVSHAASQPQEPSR